MLEGETDVHVNPQDHDDLHIIQHKGQLEDARRDPDRDPKAIGQLVQHTLAHEEQKRTKMLLQALTSHIVQQMSGQQQPNMGSSPLPPQLASMYSPPGAPASSPGLSPAPGNGDIPPSPQQAGAAMAPQPHDGMM